MNYIEIGLSFLKTKTLHKAFSVLILIAVCFVAFVGNAATLFSKKESAAIKTAVGLQDALTNPYPAPEIKGINAWLNSDALTIASLKGKVILIDFWTYSCINCIRTLPYITKWDETYRDKGLVIIGIHSPEFGFEKNINNVKKTLQSYNIKYPVALDNNLDSWTAFKNRFWPAHYLIDKSGNVVYTHFGEGNYTETENNIRYLLGLKGEVREVQQNVSFNYNQTPETYLGLERAENFASPEKLAKNITNFTAAKSLPKNNWALSGKWKIEAQKIEAQEANAKLQLNFTAKKVFLVLGSKDSKPVTLSLLLNGKTLTKEAGSDVKKSAITVSAHQLYELVNQDSAKNGLLEIKTSAAGLEAYAFTFGN
ncbi:MAG: thioredoxin family protein [Proteobacteria bacterium]|nr:thioredoxin family protein [Pseudomonadota bacterium]